MINMLETGMTGDMGMDYRGVVLWWCWVHLFRGRCGLIFVIIIVAPAVKVLGAFVLMWRAEILITTQSLTHVT